MINVSCVQVNPLIAVSGSEIYPLIAGVIIAVLVAVLVALVLAVLVEVEGVNILVVVVAVLTSSGRSTSSSSRIFKPLPFWLKTPLCYASATGRATEPCTGLLSQ